MVNSDILYFIDTVSTLFFIFWFVHKVGQCQHHGTVLYSRLFIIDNRFGLHSLTSKIKCAHAQNVSLFCALFFIAKTNQNMEPHTTPGFEKTFLETYTQNVMS